MLAKNQRPAAAIPPCPVPRTYHLPVEQKAGAGTHSTRVQRGPGAWGQPQPHAGTPKVWPSLTLARATSEDERLKGSRSGKVEAT